MAKQPRNFDTVHKLCCCLKLTTGMSLLLYLVLLLSFLGFIFSIFQIVVNALGEDSLIFKFDVKDLGELTAHIILIIFHIINAFVCYIFIRAIKAEDASGALPFLVLNGVYITFYFFGAVATLSPYLFLGLTVYIYIYTCAYSLYDIFSNNFELVNSA